MLRQFSRTTHPQRRRWREHATLCFGLVLVSVWLCAGCEPPVPPTPPPAETAEPPPVEITPAEPTPALQVPTDADTPEPPAEDLAVQEEPTVPTEPATPKSSTAPTLDLLPEEFPYPMTAGNRHVWQALIFAAAEDETLLQKLLPDTEEKLSELGQNVFNTHINFTPEYDVFMKVLLQKWHAINPNNVEPLRRLTAFYPAKTRSQQLELVALWEKTLDLAKAQGLSIKTPYLAQLYIYLGQYEKAIQNIREQEERAHALLNAGVHDPLMFIGLLPTSMIPELEKRLDQQRIQKRSTSDR